MSDLKPHSLLAAGVLMVAVGVTACNRHEDDRTAGEKVDSAIASVDEKTDAAKAEISRDAEQAKQSASQAAADAKEAMQHATQTATTAVADAAITATIKAKLAADSDLKALSIDVNTNSGYVALHGTAPDEAARARATGLASSVNGVVGVDNQLVVSNKS